MNEERRKHAKVLNIIASMLLIVALTVVGIGSLYGTPTSIATGVMFGLLLYNWMTEIRAASTEMMVQAYTEKYDVEISYPFKSVIPVPQLEAEG